MIGAGEYIDSRKDTWRGWKWNSIAKAACNFNPRLPPSEVSRRLGDKTVLYLVGPEDHDRRKALAKGFANHNLIAVDVVQERIDEVRRAGGLGICAPLQQVILHWPHDWPIDVIDADLCHGFVSDVRALQFCMCYTPAVHTNSVVSLNLMRGRDQHSNEIRTLCKIAAEFIPKGAEHEHDIVKHRGSNWLMNLTFFIHRMKGYGKYPKGYIGIEPETVRECFQAWKPAVNSYQSKTSSQYFDSVVHRWAFHIDGLSPDHPLWASLKDGCDDLMSPACANNEGVRERIAALRAVRTKKVKSLQ
jgi:hypothetical protein